MPIYEYRCDRCGKRFEVIQKFVDAPLTEHEGCGGAVERLISTSALQFKGSGWYVNDYARAGSKAAGVDKSGDAKSGDDKKSETKSESKSDSKGDSKSESKSDSKSDSSSSTTSTPPATNTKS